jgi:hypothetical protein
MVVAQEYLSHGKNVVRSNLAQTGRINRTLSGKLKARVDGLARGDAGVFDAA